MLTETLFVAATVWYVPGWMRTEVPQEGVMPAMSNAFPKAEIAFKAWDGDKAVWPTRHYMLSERGNAILLTS